MTSSERSLLMTDFRDAKFETASGTSFRISTVLVLHSICMTNLRSLSRNFRISEIRYQHHTQQQNHSENLLLVFSPFIEDSKEPAVL